MLNGSVQLSSLKSVLQPKAASCWPGQGLLQLGLTQDSCAGTVTGTREQPQTKAGHTDACSGTRAAWACVREDLSQSHCLCQVNKDRERWD